MRVIGVDEAGRGAWAGPLAIGAARRNSTPYNPGFLLKDSKLLTKIQRLKLYSQLKKYFEIETVFIDSKVIDRIGLTKASKMGILKALYKMKINDEQIVIDGSVNFLSATKFEDRSTTLIKADQKIQEVMAAAIAAKVERDNIMQTLHASYPEYGFQTHVGYGTSKHQQLLKSFGPCPVHRFSFRPIRGSL